MNSKLVVGISSACALTNAWIGGWCIDSAIAEGQFVYLPLAALNLFYCCTTIMDMKPFIKRWEEGK